MRHLNPGTLHINGLFGCTFKSEEVLLWHCTVLWKHHDLGLLSCRRQNRGRGVSLPPPLFQGWHTHFWLMLNKKTVNLSILPVLLSALSQVSLLLSLKSTVFACCPSLFLHFLPCFTNTSLLFSRRDLKNLRVDCHTSWPPSHSKYFLHLCFMTTK